MAKKFQPLTLPEVTEQYLHLQRQPATLKDYERLQNTFLKVLQRVKSPAEIREALRLDTERELPVQIKSPAYERLLALDGRTVALLREYAQEMYEYGPEWNNYADMLWDEADMLEGV